MATTVPATSCTGAPSGIPSSPPAPVLPRPSGSGWSGQPSGQFGPPQRRPRRDETSERRPDGGDRAKYLRRWGRPSARTVRLRHPRCILFVGSRLACLVSEVAFVDGLGKKLLGRVEPKQNTL